MKVHQHIGSKMVLSVPAYARNQITVEKVRIIPPMIKNFTTNDYY